MWMFQVIIPAGVAAPARAFTLCRCEPPIPDFLSLLLQGFLLGCNRVQLLDAVLQHSFCHGVFSFHSVMPRQALKYLRISVCLTIPLSCFPVLCGILDFPFGTPVYLRLTILFCVFCFIMVSLYTLSQQTSTLF